MAYRRIASIVPLAGLLLVGSNALAHIQLDEPAQRCADQKAGPCGGCNDRSSTVTVYEPGQTITVRWRETINHPGHYRIAFDDDGQDDFQDPTGFDDIQDPPVLPVLLDGILDPSDGTGPREATVTLPNVECENCTLQLIQVMTDKGPTYGDNDLYYQCADIALRVGGAGDPDAGPTPGVDAGPTPGTDAGPDPDDGDSGGCQSGGAGSLATLLLVAGALLFVRRRGRAAAK
ncbi:SCE4755 family polysaccharide monooxygenase-like protein [Haliangium sp.]|uniref:SCE4755 family polysaccharide monooxygenase-like protein n=1 Tax=Haliangium sp. TaxID=2663208 RepID=UPI003D0BDC0A